MDKDNLLVFNISFVLLTLEVLYTRIFSVVLWYHYAFLIVSLSLLGLGAGGVFYLLSQKKLEDNTLYWLTPLLPLSILSGLYTVTHTPLNPTLPFHEVYWKWLVYCLAISAPYVIGGVCMTDIYTKKHKKIESLYASDLMGAGLACMAVVVMLPILGGENSVLLASILAGITALTVYWKSTNKGLLITLFVIFILLNFYFMESTKFKIQYQHIDKTKWISKSFITKWNVFSRVDITPGVKVSWAQSKLWENQTNTSIPVYTLLIDSGAATAILLNLSDLSVLYYDLPYVGYDLINKGDKTALIIGSGGGVDVLSALYFNYSKITAVEINPAVIDSVNEVNPEIYNNPKIQVEINDGRGFIRGSPQKYDMIGLTLVDTWAALNSGAYSLSENFLYTREAFGEYLDHLTPQGIVSISWWKQRRSRFLSVVAEAYKRRNIEHPEDYVIVINNGRLDTFLLKREPFTDDEIKTIKAKADKLGFNAYSQDKMTELFGKVDPYLITDDNPFFFNDWIGHRVILSIIIISVILLSILIILPLIAKGNLRDIKTLTFPLF